MAEMSRGGPARRHPAVANPGHRRAPSNAVSARAAPLPGKFGGTIAGRILTVAIELVRPPDHTVARLPASTPLITSSLNSIVSIRQMMQYQNA
ncbi:hypothetical protein GIY62_10630 [Burkholderia plantarii]|nr:hypothetical protein GIY62_10630 [Burkholderia plantarii]